MLLVSVELKRLHAASYLTVEFTNSPDNSRLSRDNRRLLTFRLRKNNGASIDAPSLELGMQVRDAVASRTFVS
jgi:hypothetical protein